MREWGRCVSVVFGEWQQLVLAKVVPDSSYLHMQSQGARSADNGSSIGANKNSWDSEERDGGSIFPFDFRRTRSIGARGSRV
jgi:hypothetical protein